MAWTSANSLPGLDLRHKLYHQQVGGVAKKSEHESDGYEQFQVQCWVTLESDLSHGTESSKKTFYLFLVD